MPAQVIDRGRGPEIAGTRVTVYRIMDYLREGASPTRIAAELQLEVDEVQAALDFIGANQAAVDANYESILHRHEQQRLAAANSAVDPEQLKERIRSRGNRESTHAGPSRQ